MKKIIISIISIVLFYSVTSFSKSADINTLLLAEHLQPGDTIGLITPGFKLTDKADLKPAIEKIEALGLKARIGDAVYIDIPNSPFAGSPKERANDINQMFKDPEIKAIIALRGGRGSIQLLELLDYEVIKQNPKIFMGFSDLTTLLHGINTKTGLVTFHGPMPGFSKSWNEFSINYLQEILFGANITTFKNPIDKPIITIKKGVAQGRLYGGNGTTFNSIIGSNYLPDFKGAILFIEDVEESQSKIERILDQLKLAGILDEISGFIFGDCTDCESSGGTADSRPIIEIIRNFIEPLNIPAWYGAAIGHEDRLFPLPIGAKVEIDAAAGTITMIEPAVKKPELINSDTAFTLIKDEL